MGLQWVSNWLHRHDTGSTLPSLNTTNLARLPLLLPPRQYQDAVATILEGLDDKIAVNERIVAVADDLVRSFYVRESYGCHATIRIGDIGALVRDGVIADMIVGDENYIALEHMPRRNLWLSAWGTSAGVVSQKNRFLTGDVLFGKLRPYFHKVGVAFVNGTSSTDIFVIRPRVVTYRGWLLASLASDKVVEHASAVGDGTRMPRARWEDLANFEVPWIGDQRSRTFDDIVASLTNRVRAAVMESKVLADLRDTLLPGLMSGQIRVREAERIVEDVT
jgi:type I restriction enzyme S subunit